MKLNRNQELMLAAAILTAFIMFTEQAVKVGQAIIVCFSIYMVFAFVHCAVSSLIDWFKGKGKVSA